MTRDWDEVGQSNSLWCDYQRPNMGAFRLADFLFPGSFLDSLVCVLESGCGSLFFLGFSFCRVGPVVGELRAGGLGFSQDAGT